MVRLFFLFTLPVTLPLAGHCAVYTSLMSWAGWEKQAVKNGSDHSDDSSRFSGPFAMPGASGTANNSETFTSFAGGGFSSGDDLGDLFKRRPGSGMRPFWDTRIVLKIMQGWNEQFIIIPGQVPTGIGHSGGTGQAGSQGGDLDSAPPTQFQGSHGRQNGRQNQDSGGGSDSDEDDGAGGSSNSGPCQICKKKTALVFNNKCKECLDRESGVLEQESTEERPSAMGQDREADTSAIHLFEWFKTLDSDERLREDCFHRNDYYKLSALYRLLTKSFISDKNTLSEFYPKWVKFLNGSLSLYHLISEVGELAKSQGIEDYVEVARIVKALALYEFENEAALEQFSNELLNQLMNNNFLASDDPSQIVYSEIGYSRRSLLIKYIFEIFKDASLPLEYEQFPSRLITIRMLNQFARTVYGKYGFAMPDIDSSYGNSIEVPVWDTGEYSFVTLSNIRYLRGVINQPLHILALKVTVNEYLYFRDVEAMLVACVLIRSMLGQRLSDMFPEHVRFAQHVPSQQLELLKTFTLKASEQLVKFLKDRGAEEKDKFIHSMFMIFGMVPEELSDELSDPEPAPLTQADTHAVAHSQYQQSETSTSQSVTLDSAMAQE